MELLLGIAKINKAGGVGPGDGVDVTERPAGGISVILSDGHGGGRSAATGSVLLTKRAAQLIAEGIREGAVVRALHDYLCSMQEGRQVAELTMLSADLESQLFLLSRNTTCPVILRHEFGIDIYDEPSQSLGAHKSAKAMTAQRPLEEGLIAVTFSSGVLTAGRKRGRVLDLAKITRLLEKSRPEEVQFIADTILEQALALDEFQAADPMTVAVVGVGAGQPEYRIERRSVSYPV